MRTVLTLMAMPISMLLTTSAHSQPSLESGTVAGAAERLKPGEYFWAPQVAPKGPQLLIVSLATQRAVLYRNGVPIGISTVSTGRPGYRTPTGVFTILQRHVEHRSTTYNNASMPYMQRLTWKGVALHAGNLPGYPASHGCIRLPAAFARLLYGVSHLGMTVVITDKAVVPRLAPSVTVFAVRSAPASMPGTQWRPELSPSGPVSIVISSSDSRIIVLRNGVVIGRAPVTFDAPVGHTSLYVLRSSDPSPQNWIRVALPGQEDVSDPVDRGRIQVADDFRRSVESVLQQGTTVVVTSDSLEESETGKQTTVIDDGERR